MRRIHILNTNKSYDKTCEEDMLKEQKCSAYYGHWKHLIETIKMGDLVFLYSNGKGIIARGVATGIVEMADYQGKENEEYYMHLDRFETLYPYLSPSEVKIVTNMNIVFGQTLFSFAKYESGLKLWQHISKNNINIVQKT